MLALTALFIPYRPHPNVISTVYDVSLPRGAQHGVVGAVISIESAGAARVGSP